MDAGIIFDQMNIILLLLRDNNWFQKFIHSMDKTKNKKKI